MCLELMIEQAKENVSCGRINICVRSPEGPTALESEESAQNPAVALCMWVSSILMEAACAQQLQCKSLCLLISYYMARFLITI